MKTLKDKVQDWLEINRPNNYEKILELKGDGDNWQGSTEAGFYYSFALHITWRSPKGIHRESIEGEDMANLWNYLMKDDTNE